jgi:hypothetical protein
MKIDGRLKADDSVTITVRSAAGGLAVPRTRSRLGNLISQGRAGVARGRSRCLLSAMPL